MRSEPSVASVWHYDGKGLVTLSFTSRALQPPASTLDILGDSCSKIRNLLAEFRVREERAGMNVVMNACRMSPRMWMSIYHISTYFSTPKSSSRNLLILLQSLSILCRRVLPENRKYFSSSSRGAVTKKKFLVSWATKKVCRCRG